MLLSYVAKDKIACYIYKTYWYYLKGGPSDLGMKILQKY